MGTYNLKGKTVVITGATGGIGSELALEYARKGARVVLNGRRKDALDKLREGVGNLGGDAFVFPGDVTSTQDMKALTEHAVRETGRLDVMMLGAGYGLMGAIQNVTIDQWRRQMEVNFFGVLNGFYAALPHLMKQGSGQVVIISSLSGRVAMGLSAPYCASKFALWGFADSIRAELRRHNIDVIAVYPNFVKTAFQGNIESSDLNVPADLAWKMGGQNPDYVARKIVGACEKRKGEVVFTAIGKIGVRLLPLSYHVAELSRRITLPITRKMLTGK